MLSAADATFPTARAPTEKLNPTSDWQQSDVAEMRWCAVLGLTTDYTCLGHRLKLPCWLEVRQCHQQVTRTVCEGYLEPRLASLSGFTLILFCSACFLRLCCCSWKSVHLTS